jgi:hypothetical protein
MAIQHKRANSILDRRNLKTLSKNPAAVPDSIHGLSLRLWQMNAEAVVEELMKQPCKIVNMIEVQFKVIYALQKVYNRSNLHHNLSSLFSVALNPIRMPKRLKRPFLKEVEALRK